MIQRIALRRTLAHGAVTIAEVIRPDTDFEVQAYSVFISVRFFFNTYQYTRQSKQCGFSIYIFDNSK